VKKSERHFGHSDLQVCPLPVGPDNPLKTDNPYPTPTGSLMIVSQLPMKINFRLVALIGKIKQFGTQFDLNAAKSYDREVVAASGIG
jgi:hypothetical protein